ncbi:MAG: YdcF family protein [Chloroflexota bacterium]|nr:YdcF family protein [Chloroflexota bacterium]
MSKSHKYVAARPRPNPGFAGRGPKRWAYHKPVYMQSPLLTFLRRLGLVALVALGLGVLTLGGYKLLVEADARTLMYEVDDPKLPHSHVALVFGAGLRPDGGPSAILEDRVATAADLYKAGKVDKLLMTGDNGDVDYNEVAAMLKAAVARGVPDDDIVLDYAGFNTWDSCYRAREVFSLKEATLVTQRFHLPRALHACNYLKVKAIGVIADRQPYNTFNNEVREIPALAGNLFRIIINDQPRFLGPKVNVDEPQVR